MTEQVVAARRTSAKDVALWALASLRAISVGFVYIGLLVGLAFSVALSDEPPNGARGWGQVLLVFMAFTVVPPGIALLVGRTARARISGALLVSVMLWTVTLTSMLCFAIFWVV